MLDGATTVSSISLPASVKTIGVYAFEGTDWYHMQGNFVEPIPGLLYKYKGTDEEVIIPSSIKVVNEYAFVNRDTIDVSVWRGNRRVTKITFAIGSEATEIRDNAFYDCIYLRDINLPETLRLIAPSALTNTGIRNDSNGMLIAYGDASAVLIKYNGTATSVEIPAVVTVINAEAFKNNTTLTSVTVPENSSLKVIAESAFEGCTALANFNIPSSVVFIGKDAFRGTPWLGMQPEFIVENERLFLYSGTEQDVVIPAGITSIIGGAFASLTAPNSVEITQYIEILDGAFDNVTVIYVPDEDKEFYMDIWEEYASKIAGVSEKP
ncbi:MAG: leucine-rich repeat domain-containing protein, partial [Clostridia bacterium]